jgi:hypothetical protein
VRAAIASACSPSRAAVPSACAAVGSEHRLHRPSRLVEAPLRRASAGPERLRLGAQRLARHAQPRRRRVGADRQRLALGAQRRGALGRAGARALGLVDQRAGHRAERAAHRAHALDRSVERVGVCLRAPRAVDDPREDLLGDRAEALGARGDRRALCAGALDQRVARARKGLDVLAETPPGLVGGARHRRRALLAQRRDVGGGVVALPQRARERRLDVVGGLTDRRVELGEARLAGGDGAIERPRQRVGLARGARCQRGEFLLAGRGGDLRGVDQRALP